MISVDRATTLLIVYGDKSVLEGHETDLLSQNGNTLDPIGINKGDNYKSPGVNTPAEQIFYRVASGVPVKGGDAGDVKVTFYEIGARTSSSSRGTEIIIDETAMTSDGFVPYGESMSLWLEILS